LKRGSLWAVGIAGLLVSCATLKAPFESSAEERFNQGLEALARGEYPVAYGHLSWVAEHHSHEKYGQQALLALAAMELDPRNQSRRIEVGADMAANYLRLPEKPLWTQPVAQTLYLLSLELGAAEERAERAERQAERVAEKLPNLPGPSVTAKLRTTEQERERLARRVDALEKQLQEKEQELERIKKTIRR
jgi:tetratricopeptide (TPR) repeat protein